ncbi:MAG: hypothetical protein ABJP87_19020 [Bauldia litoralis]
MSVATGLRFRSRLAVGGVLAAAVIGLGLLASGPSATDALAASGKTSKTGAAVQITGNGEKVDASGASVVIRGTASKISAGGALVDIQAKVDGDVEAGGAQVSIAGDVGGDLHVGGGLVEISGSVGGEAYVGGAVVRFNATAAKDVKAGAATLEIGSDAKIAGALYGGGASVTLDGAVDGVVDVWGAAVIINGKAGGDVTVSADQVIVASTATIAGDLIVRSKNDPVIEDGASITGQVRIEEPRPWFVVPDWLLAIGAAVIAIAGAILAGAILLLIGRGAFEEGLGKAAFRPVSSGLIGLALLIILPIIAVILMTTVIGLSFGVALLMVVPFLLVAGHAVAAGCIGMWILDRSGGPRSAGRLIVFIILGAVILGVIWLIPVAGPIVAFLAMLIGTGAYLRTLIHRMRHGAGLPPV